MASNQRENARKEKQREKDIKVKKIIWIILIAVVLILAAMRFAEIDFASLKEKFTDENGKFTISQNVQTNAYPYSLDSSDNVKVHCVNDKVNVLTETSYTVLNPNDAQVMYTYNHGYSNPILSFSGNYSCLIDQGSNRFRLDTNSENVYETKLDNKILCASVSKNGNVIYAVESKDAKSTVYVVNKSLKKLMSFDVNEGYVVDTAIDNSGKKFAYAVVNSKNAKFITTVYTINMNDEKPIASFEFAQTYAVDLHYSSSSDLYFIGDNCVSVISSQKKLTEVFKKNKVHTVCVNYTKNDELIYVYSDYSESSENSVAYIKSSGKIKTNIDLKQKAKYVNCSSNEICVLFSDKVVTYSLTKGEMKKEIKCDDSLKSVNKLSSRIFVQRGNLIDVIE